MAKGKLEKNPSTEPDDFGQNKMFAAFEAADDLLMKKYITKLSNYNCTKLELSDGFDIGKNVLLYRVARVVYDSNENVQDKLTTVYSTILSLKNCGLVMILKGKAERTDMYLGVVCRDLEYVLGKFERGDEGRILKNTFESNFPGSELVPVNNVSIGYDSVDDKCKREIIEEILDGVKCVSAVSSIPALRNSNERKSIEFVQGMEKFIDAMRGQKYSAVFVADAMDNSKIEAVCSGYEDIYSQLAPFKQSVKTINKSKSLTDAKGVIKGTTDTIGESISKVVTESSSFSKTHSDTVGGGVGVNIKNVVDISGNYNHTTGRINTDGTAESKGNTKNTSKSLTEQNSVTTSLTEQSGEALQLTHENRAVKTLLDKIDEQIKRLRSCEDFGLFNAGVYFLSPSYDTAVAAASTFKSVTRGENSSLEASAVNVWRDKENVENIKTFISYFYHPEFYSPVFSSILKNTETDGKDQFMTVSAATLISGREIPYLLSMPKKSVAGVPVIECAEFGREIVTADADYKATLPLGKVYHMRKEEAKLPLNLNADALTAHTFITGSTGSGKSTTIYKLLKEALRYSGTDEDRNIKFMVVEPAKGEYKNTAKAFGAKVYGTNPRLTPMLRINPFRFHSDKIHIYEHMDKLTEIFNVCWPMYAAMPAVLKAAVENAYKEAGWDLVKSQNAYGEVYPTFDDVCREVNSYIDKSQYSDETKGNYKGSLLTRLESLTNGINGMIFTSSDIEDSELFDENVIIDLSRVGSMETKALIMGVLILKLQEYRTAMAKGSNSSLKHITVLEEAHNLLKRTSTEQTSEGANLLGKSVEMLANSIAEMRTFGEGFIIADQSPGLLDLSVIRNTNTKIIMRLPDYSDRELVGKAANLNESQIEELAKLPKGVAAVYQSEWINPVLCKVERPEGVESQYIPEPESLKVDNISQVVGELIEISKDKTDNIDTESFLQKLTSSSISSGNKVKIIRYTKNRREKYSRKLLASILFNLFENTQNVIDTAVSDLGANDVEMLQSFVMAELKPQICGLSSEHEEFISLHIIREYLSKSERSYPILSRYVEETFRDGGII